MFKPCLILSSAVFNISKQQNNLLKTYPLDSVKVYNYVTDNKYTLPIRDKAYYKLEDLQNLFEY
jgi:hypothetical protein